MFCLDSRNGGFNEALHSTNVKAILKWGLIGYFHFLSALCSQSCRYSRVHTFNLRSFTQIHLLHLINTLLNIQQLSFRSSHKKSVAFKSNLRPVCFLCSALQKRILISQETPFPFFHEMQLES